MLQFQFQPVRVAVEEDGEGQLVFLNDWLIGLLVRLSAQHEDCAGHWFLESSYGTIGDGQQPIFGDLEQAEHWFASQVVDRRSEGHLWKADGRRDRFITGERPADRI